MRRRDSAKKDGRRRRRKTRVIACVAAASIAWLATTLPAGEAQTRESSPVDEFALQYARTYLKLTQVNLQKAEQFNARVRDTVPASMVASLREDVAVAENLLAISGKDPDAREYAVFLGMARGVRVTAENEWRRAHEANIRVPGTVSALDVESLRLRAQLARINLARGKTLRDGPRKEQDRWKFHLLIAEVLRLGGQLQRIRIQEGGL